MYFFSFKKQLSNTVINMSITEKDYKQSLFLPKTDFPMRANLPEREKEWLSKWEKIEVYKK